MSRRCSIISMPQGMNSGCWRILVTTQVWNGNGLSGRNDNSREFALLAGNLMNFIFKMAWRDTRASRRRLLLFSLAIVLGVASLVAVGSLRENLRTAIEEQTKTLLGADLVVTSRAKLEGDAAKFIGE